MSVDIKLDGNHDLAVKNGQLVLVSGANKKAQQIKIALLTFAEEWFLDNTVGLPYFNDILVKNAERSKVENVFRKAILSVENVLSVKAISLFLDRKNRMLSVHFEADTSEGVIRDVAQIRSRM
ncbi:hypothetical protein [Actinobacillus pleuropneumoniae]|uniref:hypothetical protein n=1 Tax=Actinobacillus pleuropneumoniae TaxID=715 RepID=UPI0022786258|nr:hypothetical protein [Actinobacillus pleuropneumoniae]MCY6395077.1 hypothetical protein [Actinobacillus pleuropneumoniae]MCY6408877.1 hypothetical protein [Actinobacillus pleuropneumoniae]